MEYERMLIQERGDYCSKLKNGKLKTKKLLTGTMLDEQEPSVQSADKTEAVQVWSWGNMYLLKPRNWPSQHLYLKINSGFHARKNLSEGKILRSDTRHKSRIFHVNGFYAIMEDH